MKKTSCAIIIYNYESFQFLKASIRQIRKHKHPDIEQRIIISEQSRYDYHYNEIVAEFGNNPDITIVPMKALFSGYSIDYILRYVHIDSEFVCTMDVDAFPISNSWLSMPITMMQEDGFAFVGGLAENNDGERPIYPPNPFYCMSQFFNVGRYKDFMELSLKAGFTKFHQRENLDMPMTFENDDWAKWAAPDYINRGSDDAMVAHCWCDKHTEKNKLSLSISHIIGSPSDGSSYGRILDDIVFHFGYSYTSIGVEDHMGNNYMSWRDRINENFTDEMVQELVNLAIQCPSQIISRGVWDGKLKKASPPYWGLNNKIELLKNENITSQ